MSACAVFGRRFAFAGALLVTAAFAAPAYADIEVVVVTAEKRAADVQTVPVAISVFTSEKRDAIGINSVQDMTNFTPGLAYQTSLDRVFLRGVGRQLNSQSYDTPVANYDDGLFETFAVAAGRSSLELDRVEVLRGPQGTLSGRNALAGALNQITRRPQTDEFHGEVRETLGSYDHYTTEAEITGPIDDVWAFRVYADWDKQDGGWAKNLVPNAIQGTNDPMFLAPNPSAPANQPTYHFHGDQGNRIDTFYMDTQIQAKFSDHFEMWTKIQGAQWWNGAGGPGADLEGWTPADYPTGESTGGFYNNAGFACSSIPGSRYFTTNVPAVNRPQNIVAALPGADPCANPGLTTPWREARMVQTRVRLPSYWSLNSQWTWHADGFDIKYIGGGSYYRYHLSSMADVHTAPIYHYDLAGVGCAAVAGNTNGLCRIDNRWQFNPEEENSFISNEINLISTDDSPLQWVAGAYQFSQQANQPGDLYNQFQPQINAGTPANPFGSIAGIGNLCDSPIFLGGNGHGTNGVCAPSSTFRVFDTRNNIHDHSYAAFGQLDWKATDELKFTLGLRYSKDHKFGTESVRDICYYGFCDAFGFAPDAFGGFGGAAPLDVTQTGLLAASGFPTIPPGVRGLTTYDANSGFATRRLNAEWDGLTGTAGVEWQPDNKTLAYAKYSIGYKDGGYFEGANTSLIAEPFTKAEHVQSVEVGLKRTWGDWLTTNVAAFHYAYHDLQIPITFPHYEGVVLTNQTGLFNLPGSISQGVELEVTANPFEDLNLLFNYSYDDAHVSRGTGIDPADPGATAPGAKPLYTEAQCLASLTAPVPLCTQDPYIRDNGPNAFPAGALGTTALVGTGWYIPQNMAGSELPNAARNKIAFNAMYTIHLADLGTLTPSVSYVWRDKQTAGPGAIFARPYNTAPAWDQIDLRANWVSEDERYEVIVFGKNITDNIIYDVGAVGTRLQETNNFTGPGCGVVGGTAVPTALGFCNFVQGLNGPTGFGKFRGEDNSGHVKTYQVAPPALFGVEFHWKFL